MRRSLTRIGGGTRTPGTRSTWAPGSRERLGAAFRAGRTPGGLTADDARDLGLPSPGTGPRSERATPAPSVAPAVPQKRTGAIPAVARRRRERIVAACASLQHVAAN